MIDELGRAGVDGRGGAGFPLVRKLAAVTARGRRRGRGAPLVVANAAEGGTRQPQGRRPARARTAPGARRPRRRGRRDRCLRGSARHE
ncbi:hypothetical protein WDV91_06080 [Curtobacterium flaccumfaciens pv. flaccumfaciens]